MISYDSMTGIQNLGIRVQQINEIFSLKKTYSGNNVQCFLLHFKSSWSICVGILNSDANGSNSDDLVNSKITCQIRLFWAFAFTLKTKIYFFKALKIYLSKSLDF